MTLSQPLDCQKRKGSSAHRAEGMSELKAAGRRVGSASASGKLIEARQVCADRPGCRTTAEVRSS